MKIHVTIIFTSALLFLFSSFNANSFNDKESPTDSAKNNNDSIWAFSSDGREIVDVITDSGKVIQVVDVDGLAYSGDMILGKTEDLKLHGLKLITDGAIETEEFLGTKAAIRYPSSGYKWPNGLVPYVFASNLGYQARQDMQYAFDHWHSNSNIRFVQRTNEGDYLYIQGGGGCSSWVGKQGGRQNVTLAEQCGRCAAVHELGHAVGFFHEQKSNLYHVLY